MGLDLRGMVKGAISGLPTPSQVFEGASKVGKAVGSVVKSVGNVFNTVNNVTTLMGMCPPIGAMATPAISLSILASIPRIGDMKGIEAKLNGQEMNKLLLMKLDEELKKLKELQLKALLGKMMVGSLITSSGLVVAQFSPEALAIIGLVVNNCRKKATAKNEVDPRQEAIEKYNRYNGSLGGLYRYVDGIDAVKSMWNENVEGCVKSIPDEQWNQSMLPNNNMHLPGIYDKEVQRSKGMASGFVQELGNMGLDFIKLPATIAEGFIPQTESNGLLEEILLGDINKSLDNLYDKVATADDFAKGQYGGRAYAEVAVNVVTMNAGMGAESANFAAKEREILEAYKTGTGLNNSKLADAKILQDTFKELSNLNKGGLNTNDEVYAGVREASEYLKSQGVPRQYRKQILESFDVRTIKMETAGDSTFGIRFYGGNANAEGRYLFETFSPTTNRNSLALPYEWNSMTSIQQFQVKSGTTMITGNAAGQTSFGSQYIGGAKQWYINSLEDLIK